MVKKKKTNEPAVGHPEKPISKAQKRGRPKSNFKIVIATSQVGTKPGETRATFIINEQQLEAIKALAHWERLTIKDVLAEALTKHIDTKKGELPKAMKSYQVKAEAIREALKSAVTTVQSELGDKKAINHETPGSKAVNKAAKSWKKLNGHE